MTSVGIIVHWGLYSVPAYDSKTSVLRRKTHNGSEWYQKRLEVKEDSFRPLAGHKETKKFHEENYGDAEYSDFTKSFLAESYNPDEWMKLFKSCGATYAIITAKHHDGFCLWKTKTTDYNSVDTGPKRDLVKEFAEAARSYGLKFGVYFSWMEFGKSCTKDFMDTVAKPQIKELIKYEPEIFWFDGGWECKSKYSKEIIEELCDRIHKKIPTAIINDRLGWTKTEQEDPNYLGKADYRSYGDRAIPEKKPKVPWESIQTIGYSWGRNTNQTKDMYKSGEELHKLYKKVKKLNGKFLINLGPNSDGTFDKREVKTLTKFGEILQEQ